MRSIEMAKQAMARAGEDVEGRRTHRRRPRVGKFRFRSRGAIARFPALSWAEYSAAPADFSGLHSSHIT